jgi:hypothetical protein
MPVEKSKVVSGLTAMARRGVHFKGCAFLEAIGRANFITGELPIRPGLTTVGQAGCAVIARSPASLTPRTEYVHQPRNCRRSRIRKSSLLRRCLFLLLQRVIR